MEGKNSVLVEPRVEQMPFAFRPRPAGSQAGPSLTVQDVLRILKKHTFLILAIFVLFMIVTVGGTFFWAKYAPSYRATGLIKVESPVAPEPLKGESQVANTDIIEQYMNTQATYIKSQEILQQVIDDPYIKQTAWYQSFEGDRDEAMLDMEERLSASPVRDTWFVQIAFSWKKPEECAKIVNTVLVTYYLDHKHSAKRGLRGEIDEYKQKVRNLGQEIQQKVLEQERFRASRDIPFIQQRRASIGDKVTALNALLTEVFVSRDQAQSLYDKYNQPGAASWMVNMPEIRQSVNDEPLVQHYTDRLGNLRISLQLAKQRGGNHRSIKQIETEYATVKTKLYAKKREAIANACENMREQVKVIIDTSNMKAVEIQDQLFVAKAELAEFESQIAKYLTTEREIETLRTQLETVRNYLLGLQVQLKASKLVRVHIASRAVRPLQRSNPKWLVNIPAGVMLGLLVGVGLAFLLEFMSTTVKSPADVLRQLHMPLLGQIPSQEDDESSAEDMNKLLVDAPHSLVAESFRQLRANLLFCAPAEQQKSILVTSCSPNEGKTCISVNLATSLALAGRKILVVDANFRRPGVASAFGVTGATEGLSNILIGHKSPESLIHKTAYENLDVLASGPLPPNPSELLSGGYLKEFIERFGSQYDTILFDGPPVLVVSDAMVLSSTMDGVILTIRAGVIARGAIQRAKDQLRRANAKLLGVVLNDVKSTRGGYFREMYRTYYEYQSPDSLTDGEA